LFFNGFANGFWKVSFCNFIFSELKIQILTTTNLKPSTLEPFPEKVICCNKTIVFRGKWYPVATKPLFFEENGTLLQQNHSFSKKMAPCWNKTMNFQEQPSLTSPVPDLDPGPPKTLKTRVFHLNGNAAKAAERMLFEF